TGDQEEFGLWEQLVERPGHTAVQGTIGVAEDNANRTPEFFHLRDHLVAGTDHRQQVYVQAKEGRLGTRRGGELLIQQRYELTSDIRVSDESPDLPPVHPAEEPVPEQPRHWPREVSDHGRREEPDRLRRPERWHFAIVRVQQHQPGHALGVDQCPVNGRRARGVVRDKGDWPQPQLGDDGVQVPDLVVGGIRVGGWLIRFAPPEKVKENDPARRNELWGQG